MSANAPKITVLTAADQRQCHATIRAGSKSFNAASRLLPRNTRLAARALYTFCRSSDDLVDDAANDGSASARLRHRLEAIYRGDAADLICDRAMAAVVHGHAIPREIPLGLIEGYGWDETGRRYQSIDDLLAYATRVAGTVGLMMTLVMGSRERHVLARAADLGLAMQLTNIARDVGEDARNGRIYLPLDWLDEAGIDPEDLLEKPRFSPQLGEVVRRLLAVADELYGRAQTGIAGLPLDCRPAIRYASLVYRDIGRVIAENGYNSVDTRAHTGTFRKLHLAARAVASPLVLKPPAALDAHPSVAHLVEAAASSAAPEIRGIDAKVGRMLELMAAGHGRRSAVQGIRA